MIFMGVIKKMARDRVMKSLQLIALVIIIVFGLLYLLSLSCVTGYCTSHDCGKGISKEGYGRVDVDWQDGYNIIGSMDGGPKFQLNHGIGETVYAPGYSGYTGFYGDSRAEGGEDSEYDLTKYPEAMIAFDGRYDTPKCDCSFGDERCCQQERGGPEGTPTFVQVSST